MRQQMLEFADLKAKMKARETAVLLPELQPEEFVTG